jgi:hypothetical protein
MPSPFPGMAPYLEGYLWPGVHNALVAKLRQLLRGSPKLDYPRLRGMLQITLCWRYPYGDHRFP